MVDEKEIEEVAEDFADKIIKDVFTGMRRGYRHRPRFYRICDPQLIMISESINRLKTFIKIRDELKEKYPDKTAEEVIEILIEKRKKLKDQDESLIV